MANFHNNYLVIAAREPEMAQLLTLMGKNLAQGEGADISLAQVESAAGVRELFAVIADSLEWDYCQAFRADFEARPMSDSAGVRLTWQGDVWVLAMDYDTADESNYWDVRFLFRKLPKGVGDFGLALFDSDEYDDYESVCARSWLLQGGMDPRVNNNSMNMDGPLYYKEHRTDHKEYGTDFRVSRSGSFSPESLLEERYRLQESPRATTSLAEIADFVALNGWSPSGSVGKVPADRHVIRSGAGLVDEEGFAYVPEGTVEVCDRAYDQAHMSASGNIRGLLPLPDTLRAIGERAFSGVLVTSMLWDPVSKRKARVVVEVPRTVERFGAGAFYGSDKVIVYDSIDSDKGVVDEGVWRRAQRQDADALSRISTIGFAGILGNLDDDRAAVGTHPFEVEVRSAQSGEVRYRVWMPVDDSKSPWQLVSVWGGGASVYYPGLDAAFDNFKYAMSKVGIATLRLRWAEQLPEDVRAKYEDFIKTGAKAKQAANILIADDDVEGLAILEPLGILRKGNIDELIECAETGLPAMSLPFGVTDFNALEHDGEGDVRPACAAYLREYRDTHFARKGASKARKPLAKAFREAVAGIDSGDPSGLAELEGRKSLASCNPEEVVHMLEHAAAFEDPWAVEKLYELFGRPEYEADALAIAILMGNEQVALALCRHGASLGGGINPVTYSKDSSARAKKRAERYRDRFMTPYKLALHGHLCLPGGTREFRWDEATERCVRTLLEEGFVTPSDLKIMLLEALNSACIEDGLDVAEALLALGADEGAEGSITTQGMEVTSAMGLLDQPFHYPSDAVEFVLRHHKEEIASWKPKYRELSNWGYVGAVAKALFPYLGPDNFRGYEIPLLINFGLRGEFDKLATILSWDGFLAVNMFDECIAYIEDQIEANKTSGRQRPNYEEARDYFVAERDRRREET